MKQAVSQTNGQIDGSEECRFEKKLWCCHRVQQDHLVLLTGLIMKIGRRNYYFKLTIRVLTLSL